MSAEVIALRIGTALVSRAANLWMGARQRDQYVHLEMDDLIRNRIPGLRAQRSVQRQFGQIADKVAERLEPMLAHEFRGLDESEREAIALAIADTFYRADLSDTAIFAADADPARLARQIRESVPQPVGLSEAGTVLYEQLLAESADCYVRIVRHLPVFTERAMTELLGRVSELGTELSRVLEQLPRRSLDAPEGTDNDSDFRHRYLEFISGTLDEVELFSFATEKPLRTKLSMAYISLRVVTDTATGRVTRKSLRRGRLYIRARSRRAMLATSEDEPSGMRVESALSRKHRVLLRGEAGSGKTTLLRWLAVTAARGNFSGDLASWNGLVPMLVRLRGYGDRPLPKPHELLDDSAGILTGLMPRAWVERQLSTGQVLLLVDGVDELLPRDRRKVRDWLRALLHMYPQIRVVVTSRPAAARQDWLEREEFLPVSLERMTQADLDSFVRQWHQAVAAGEQSLPCGLDELPDYERALTASIRDRPHLHALASNPLLAAMLCSLNLSRFRQLPRNRMELYQMAIELLVQRRDADRHIPSAHGVPLSLTEKVSVLRDLAWRLSDNNRSELNSVKALEYVTAKIGSMRHLEVEPAQVLEYLIVRSGVLRSPAEERIDFAHRSFQEYLAAAEATAEDRIGNLVGRAHLDLWRETIIMSAGHANRTQRTELITGILERAQRERRYTRRLRLLAASCLETMESVPDDLAALLDEAIDALLPPRSADDPTALAAIGEPILRKLPKNLDDIKTDSAIEIVETAVLVGGTKAIQLLAGYTQNPKMRVQLALINGWRYFDPTEYAEKILAQLPDKPGITLPLDHPTQWTPAARLPNLRQLSVLYPTNLHSLALDEVTALNKLELLNLTGNNGIDYLAKSQLGMHLRRLTLAPGNSLAAIENLNSIASLTDLRELILGGWRYTFHQLSIPDNLLSLTLDCIFSNYNLGYLSEHRLEFLELTGENAPASLATITRGTRLRQVNLAYCDLTECLTTTLALLPELETLVLGDVSLPEDLEVLAKVPTLKSLELIACSGPNGQPIDLSTFRRPEQLRPLTVRFVRSHAGESGTPSSSNVEWHEVSTQRY
ncbi:MULTISPECIES: NACHT domain-containing NTPase [unclassified Nocardia]|uniref:NACHT domain-containing protein n=1 Tax=unclassified Nocardia TaxID=2637762 RepID=UPI001CE475D7|nr:MULTISPECIES: NACHT domain-containing protein [unclassified Nocardia]